MTNKEAIETLKIAKAEVEWNYPLDYQIAFDKAIESLEKQEKYRWHDLRENPRDLPPCENVKYLYVNDFDEVKTAMGWWIIENRKSSDVVAWKEIELFGGQE